MAGAVFAFFASIYFVKYIVKKWTLVFLKSKLIFKNIRFLFLGATNYDELRNATLDSLRKSYRTIVVRHPFERLLSAYLWFLGEEKGKSY